MEPDDMLLFSWAPGTFLYLIQMNPIYSPISVSNMHFTVILHLCLDLPISNPLDFLPWTVYVQFFSHVVLHEQFISLWNFHQTVIIPV